MINTLNIIQLTEISGKPIYVNFDKVFYFVEEENKTVIFVD